VKGGRSVLLLRHGQTAWNAVSRFQGQTDIDLDDVGRVQAERAAVELDRLGPAAIVSSDLRRARDTAQPLAQLTGLPVTTDPRLREVYGGGWQGMLSADIDAQDPELRAAWRAGQDVRPGGDGETRREVGDRVAAAVREHVAGVPAGGLLVVVSHGGSISNGVQTLLGVPRECWPVVSGLNNCRWTVIQEQRDGRWVLTEHNAFSLPTEVVGDET
jgi:probable phosphoglycerate mutase